MPVERQAAPSGPQTEVARIEVFRGVKKSEETFDLPTRKKQ
jgi:hypothetical protein